MKRLLLVWMFVAVAPIASAATRDLTFHIDEGQNSNYFLRDGPVAAHLLLRAGMMPRVLVAFPAGNSGVGLWFEKTTAPVTWTLVTPPRPVNTLDAKGRRLHGIEFEVTTDAALLKPRGAVLSSIRVLRDYELQAKAPDEVLTPAQGAGKRVTWQRDRLDGAAGYLLRVDARFGAHVGPDRFAAGPNGPLRLRIRALTGETPLTPLIAPVTRAARDDARARQALEFLSYQEKFLAGSWRFDTYFGRDTMMSAMLLAPVLEPGAMESALASVLDRLAPNGEVAHEEDIGEFAVLRNAREGRGRVATPLYDYGMVDDDFMLAPLAARWLLDDASGRALAAQFLSLRGAGSSETHGAALGRNLVWLVQRAAPFAAEPRATNLVGIKAGRSTGEWRDSEQGLGGGRFAYDVNAALVPAALESAARLAESGLLDRWLDEAGRRTLARALEYSKVWTARAPQLFEVEIAAAQARAAVAAYAGEAGVDAAPALRAMDARPLRFHAVSLDVRGAPIPIVNSDEGFRLLFTTPSPEALDRCLETIVLPFPAGLMTDVGMLVANPVMAPAAVRKDFSRFAYHGTVVWSWQQALMAAGLERQLARRDLPDASRARLEAARATVWAAIGRSQAMRTSELWSWSFANGRYTLEPFGRPGADVDESNAAQLWSTVYLKWGQTPFPSK
ncbi:MAG TPA: hypothetical protein VMF52_09345 [Steroidobacteraceae bacterium]|nr:hypothetical protein [Steroidobacteraceae bacterium]